MDCRDLEHLLTLTDMVRLILTPLYFSFAENTPAGPTSVWYNGSLVRRHKSSDHSLDSQISEDELLEEVEEFTGPPLGALMTPGKPGGILSRRTHFNTSTASLPTVLKTPNKNKEVNKPNDDNW